MLRPRLVFAGTPEFAAVALDALIQQGHQVLAVYCQPDRPAGRGRQVHDGPVKSIALRHGLPVLQPLHWRDAATQQQLAAWQADLLIVVAYGLILPQAVLCIPHGGCINIHASLLPRWRGAAPIQRALLAGDTQTGVGIMQMEQGLDTGPLILERRCRIFSEDTSAQLHDRLATLGATTLLEALQQWPHWQPVPQSTDGILYAHKINKEEAVIAWDRPTSSIDQQIRAFIPWPIASTTLGTEILRIHQARPLNPHPGGTTRPGTICEISHSGWQVATGDGQMLLEKAQLPGGKILDTFNLSNSRPWIQPGTLLGAPL